MQQKGIDMNKSLLKLVDENTWVMSDHHFGHTKIGEFEPSRVELAKELGYENYEEMLIEFHNALVKPEDVVLFLGDFSFKSPQPANKMNGRKILIVGNHDSRGDHAYYQTGFELVLRGSYVNFNGNIFHCEHDDPKQSIFFTDIMEKRVAFTHYPLGFDDGYNYQPADGGFCIQRRMDEQFQMASDFDVQMIIHGHLHSKIAETEYFDYINVSGEHLEFKPTRIKDLLGKY
jgi:calcineurin-like phosphoesterase family protein